MAKRRQCRNCEWWDNTHIRVKSFPKLEWLPEPGLCRKNKPGAQQIEKTIYVGVQPFMDANDFCGEFRQVKES